VTTFIIRRILISIPVFIGITLLVFTFVALAPGNVADGLIRPEMSSDESARQEIVHRYGLDQPLPVRYVSWLANALQGELGYRAMNGTPISGEIWRGLRASLVLTGTALVLGILVGVPLGILSAVRQYSKLDFLLTGVTFLGISLPSFLLGLGGLWLLGLQFRIVPIAGMTSVGKPFDLVDFLRHLALPALILGFGYMARFMRYTRAAMLDVINAEYITTARSKGLPAPTVLWRHAFRNGLIPIITIVALLIPEAVAGAVITEQVFAWNGMGSLAVKAASARDPSLMMGIILITGIAVLVANIIADIGYAVADPRVAYDRAK
jgi:peptide/nickel transport system permease protein